MRVQFEINYRADEWQYLAIAGDIELPMHSDDGVMWYAETDIQSEIGYYYVVRCGDRLVRSEMEVAISPKLLHCVGAYDGCDMIVKRDSWIDTPISRPMSSKFFTQSVFKRHSPRAMQSGGRLILEVNYVEIDPRHTLAVVGGTAATGEWCVERAAVMADGGYPLWRVALPNEDLEYKFVILDSATHEIVAWEVGDHHWMPRGAEGVLTIDSPATPRFDIAAWRGRGVSIPVFSLRTERSMGVGDFADLRSMVDWAAERDMCVIQILPINDTTMSNSWEDSYPYNANSTVALHPQYIALREVGELHDQAKVAEYEALAKRLNALAKIDYSAVGELKNQYLHDLFEQDGASLRRKKTYREFMAANRDWLEPYALFSVLRDRYSTPDFATWGDDAIYSEALLKRHLRVSETKHEMEYYYFVQYHLDRQLRETSDYAHERGVALKGDIPIGISRTSVDAWVSPELFKMEMQAGAPPDAFARLGQNWGFPTYDWERMAHDGYSWWRGRMEKMAAYFDAYRIDHILGFFRIWEIPMTAVHGVLGHFSPALPLSAEQIEQWGFRFDERYVTPPLDDPRLAGYASQREVFEAVEDEPLRDELMLLFDEVLFVEDGAERGAYHPRIAAYETAVYGSLSESDRAAFDALYNDFYYHRHNNFWRESALRKLPTLMCATDMLVCGEDLGMIPDCVADVMSQEQILSLEIERMPKAVNCEFGDPLHYPYLSVCTTSTHDMSTIRGWWREDREQTQRYYNSMLHLDGAAPADCSGVIAAHIIDRHLQSPSMLTILPWQDWLALDEELRSPDIDGERINVPAISRHYWRYRMHLTL